MSESIIPIAIVAGVAEGAKSIFDIKSASAETEALELQSKNSILQNQQKTLSNYDVVKKVLDKQLVQATTKGIALSSPSFEAIERDTINVGAKESKNLEIEKSFIEKNLEIERKNVRNTLYGKLFGNAFDTGMSFSRLKGL